MNQIEHDNDEPQIDRKFPSPWKFLFPMLAFGFGLAWFGGYRFDFVSICLGLAVGGSLALWAIEITGNKVPDSWRTKPPR